MTAVSPTMLWLLVVAVIALGPSPTLVTSLECESYNSTECGYPHGGPCESSHRNVSCGEDGPTKTHACYVLWTVTHGPVPQENLQFKGCFLNDKQCMGKDVCVEKKHGTKHEGRNTTAFYCCCTKDFCNIEYVWDPVPTTTVRRKLIIQLFSHFFYFVCVINQTISQF